MLSELKSFHRIICPDLRGMGRSHSLDFIDRPVTVDEVVEDVLAILTHYSIDQRQIVGYSCGGLVALLVNAARRELVCGLVLLEPTLLERASLDALRAVRAYYAEAAVTLLSEKDSSIGVRQFLDLIAPNRSMHPRVERMTVQRLAGRPEGLAYALMAVNEAAWHVNRTQCIECAPTTLSLIGSKSIDEAHEFHQILAERRYNWRYQSVMGVDHALPYQKPSLCACLIFEHFRP